MSVYMDAMSGSGGLGPAPTEDDRAHSRRPAAAVSSPAAGTGSDTPDVMSPAAGLLVSPAGGSHQPTDTKGTDHQGGATALGPGQLVHSCDTEPWPGKRTTGRWGDCTCGHPALSHNRWTYCTACPTCDRFRPANDEAAGSGQPTAS